MVNISVLVALLAGMASFFAPCVLPLLPSYISYLTGISVLDEGKTSKYRRKIILASIFYIAGFSIVFVLLGLTVGGISYFLRHNYQIIQQLGGFIIFFFGLELLGIVNLTRLFTTIKPISLERFDKFTYLRSFVFGIVFSISWTPCVGAILGSILALAATSGTALEGGFLLFIYSLGISIPFLLIAIFLTTYKKYMLAVNKYSIVVRRLTGIVLTLFGLMLATGTYKYFNGYVYSLTNMFGWSNFLVNNL